MLSLRDKRWGYYCWLGIVLVLLLLTQTARVRDIFLRNQGVLARLHGDFAEARDSLASLPLTPLLHWHLYNIYAAEGIEEKALVHLHLSGYSWQTLLNLGDAYTWPALDWDSAQRWYERAWQAHQNSTILFKLGMAYEAKKEWVSSRDAYTQSLQMAAFENEQVGASNALVHLAKVYVNGFDDLDKAFPLTERSLALDAFGQLSRDKALAYYLQGEIGERRGQDVAYVIERYQRALALNPDHYWANLRLANAYYRAGYPLEKARALMLHAISLLPDSKWGYRLLADMYADAGYTVEAGEYYMIVLRIDPEDTIAKEFIERTP